MSLELPPYGDVMVYQCTVCKYWSTLKHNVATHQRTVQACTHGAIASEKVRVSFPPVWEPKCIVVTTPRDQETTLRIVLGDGIPDGQDLRLLARAFAHTMGRYAPPHARGTIFRQGNTMYMKKGGVHTPFTPATKAACATDLMPLLLDVAQEAMDTVLAHREFHTVAKNRAFLLREDYVTQGLGVAIREYAGTGQRAFDRETKRVLKSIRLHIMCELDHVPPLPKNIV